MGFFTKIKLRNSASCWLLLQEYITIHGPLNVKLYYLSESRICFTELSHLPNEILYFVVTVTLFQLRILCVYITNSVVHFETLSLLQIK